MATTRKGRNTPNSSAESNTDENKSNSIQEPKAPADNPAADFEKSGGSYSPIADAVTAREYTKPLVEMGSTGAIPPITPPFIQKPIINIAREINQPAAPVDFNASSNPALNELSVEDKRKAAEVTVDIALQGYEMVHMGVRKIVKISDNQKTQWATKKELDFNQQLSIDETGNTVTASQFFDRYNKTIDELIVVDKEFKDKITPPLVRIVMKRGWGLSDEQTAIALLMKDVGIKGSLLYGVNSSLNMIVKKLKEDTALKKKTEGTPIIQPQPSQQNVSEQPKAEPVAQPNATEQSPKAEPALTPDSIIIPPKVEQNKNLSIDENPLLEPEEKANIVE